MMHRRHPLLGTTALLAAALSLPPLALPALASSGEAPVSAQPTPAQGGRAWLGVHMGPTAEGNNEGVPVRRAIPSSPAERAGVTRGDIIAAVEGTPVLNADALVRTLANFRAGNTIQIQLAGPNPRVVQVALSAHPGPNTDFGRMLIGRQLPELRAGNLESGDTQAIAVRDGKVRIVELWATWCGPCRAAMPQITRLVSSMDKEQFEFVSVAGEDRRTVQAFMKTRAVPYTVYFDENEDVAGELWATATPTFVLVDRDGTVVDYVQGIQRIQELFDQARQLTER